MHATKPTYRLWIESREKEYNDTEGEEELESDQDPLFASSFWKLVCSFHQVVT